MTTIGAMLAAADAHFDATGGYHAIAHCVTKRVELLFRSEHGDDTSLEIRPFPQGQAGEDIAHDMLASLIGTQAADNSYFVTTYANS